MNNDTFPDTREKQIELILLRLKQLHPQSEAERYAIEQNIIFFESVRSIPKYLHWLYAVRKHIEREDLLEINELLPELDTIFHAKMAEIERRPRPGIIRPIVDYITEIAINMPHDKRFRIASLGSGSMEAERQSIERIQQMGKMPPLTIIGFDIASNARAYAEENLSSLKGVRVVQESRLTEERLLALEQDTEESVLFIVSDNDIFKLSSDFSTNTFDLVMTALFLHHLHEADRQELIGSMRNLAPRTLNYDGYQNEIVIPLLSLTGWHSPVFLNSAVFSTIRFPTHPEALRLHAGAEVIFYNHGHYRATFST